MYLKHCLQFNDTDGIRVGIECMLNCHWSNQFPLSATWRFYWSRQTAAVNFTEFSYFSW